MGKRKDYKKKKKEEKDLLLGIIKEQRKKKNIQKTNWEQLKSLNSVDLKAALELDNNFEFVRSDGAFHFFKRLNQSERPDSALLIRIDLRPSKKGGYVANLLRKLLKDISWTEEELRELNLIK